MKRYSLDKVQITEPRWVGKSDLNAAFLDEMDVERVLAGFRRTAGIETDMVSPKLLPDYRRTK